MQAYSNLTGSPVDEKTLIQVGISQSVCRQCYSSSSSPYSCRVTNCLGKSGTISWRPQYEQHLSFLSSSSVSPLLPPFIPCFNFYPSPFHFLSGKVPSKVEIETGPVLQGNEGIYHNIPPSESSHLSILYYIYWSSGADSSEGK